MTERPVIPLVLLAVVCALVKLKEAALKAVLLVAVFVAVTFKALPVVKELAV